MIGWIRQCLWTSSKRSRPSLCEGDREWKTVHSRKAKKDVTGFLLKADGLGITVTPFSRSPYNTHAATTPADERAAPNGLPEPLHEPFRVNL